MIARVVHGIPQWSWVLVAHRDQLGSPASGGVQLLIASLLVGSDQRGLQVADRHADERDRVRELLTFAAADPTVLVAVARQADVALPPVRDDRGSWFGDLLDEADEAVGRVVGKQLDAKPLRAAVPDLHREDGERG